MPAPDLTTEDKAKVRALYREACHGAGAAPRWAARDAIKAIAYRHGYPLWQLLDECGLDAAAYSASCPISR